MRITFRIAINAVLLGLCACESNPGDSARVPTIDTVARISFRGLPAPGASSPVAVSSDLDRIAVALRDGSGEILLFDSGGSLIRHIGREGGGPGEFRDVTVLTFGAKTDSLWILDEGNTRVSVFEPDAARPARDFPLSGQFFNAVWATDTTLVVQGRFRHDDSRNAFARAVRPGGISPAIVDDGSIVLDSFDDFIKPLTSSAAGGIWVADFRTPRLQLYQSSLSDFEETQFAAPALDVVPGNAAQWAPMIDTRPAILDITQDGSGDLWVLFGIPADPLPSVDDPGRALAEGRVTAADLASTLLARYERASLDDGPVQQYPQGPVRGGLLPGGLAYYFDADAAGEPTLTVVRLDSRAR